VVGIGGREGSSEVEIEEEAIALEICCSKSVRSLENSDWNIAEREANMSVGSWICIGGAMDVIAGDGATPIAGGGAVDIGCVGGA
jgi:hypothetical protein